MELELRMLLGAKMYNVVGVQGHKAGHKMDVVIPPIEAFVSRQKIVNSGRMRSNSHGEESHQY